MAMADLFRCDKCRRLGYKADKAGRLILQELGVDGMPHPTLYNRKAEVCRECFTELQQSTTSNLPHEPTFAEALDITREANHSLLIIGEDV